MIQTSESSVSYVGNNTTTIPYPVPFYFQLDEHLIVAVRYHDGGEFLKILGTDYTATGAGNPNGGSILTTAPVPPDAQITISRQVPMTQLTSYEEADAFPAKSHEAALDKLTMVDQQLARGMGTGTGDSNDSGSAFRVTTASGGMPAIPKKTDTMLGVDTDGTQILRTADEMLGWLGQVGTYWANDAARLGTRGAYPGQTGVQLDNKVIYIAYSTNPGDWKPFLVNNGVVISANGVPTAKPNPAGDIVGTTEPQSIANKTFNNCIISNPVGLTPTDVGLGNVNNTSDLDKPVSIAQQQALDLKQNLAEKAVANGYASLDPSGQVPIGQIPSSLIGSNTQFKGVWNATTNTPTIPAAAPANNSWYYIVNVAGTTNIGGISSWAIGDTVISNGTTWNKVPASQAVSSVAGRTGAVVLTKADVGLSNVDNVSNATQATAVETLTNKTINGASNTLTVRAASDISGNLPVVRLNGGSGATGNTWWCGDGTWKQPSGTGDVNGTTASVDGQLPVYEGTGGKAVRAFTGPAGILMTAANQVVSVPEADFIHNQDEKTASFEEDELLIWDSASGQMMKIKKKNLGVPVGTVIDYAGATLPGGYLWCDGGTYLKATYQALADVLGTRWNKNATEFYTPDLRGFTVAGRDNMGGTNANRLSSMGAQATTLGGAGGAQTHVLSTAELAAHAHATSSYFLGYHNAVVNGNYGLASINCGIPCGVGFNGSVMIYDGNARAGYTSVYDSNAGSNYGHNNIQPTQILNKCIKY